VAWSTGEDDVPDQHLPVELQADTARRVAWHIVNQDQVGAQLDLHSIEKREVAFDAKLIAVGRMDANGSTRGLADCLQCTHVVRVSVRQEDHVDIGIANGIQDSIGICTWIYNGHLAC
jgi:hypothetical protein